MPETDSVLTSTELQRFLEERGIDLHKVQEQGLDCIMGERSNSLAGIPGGSGECLVYLLSKLKHALNGHSTQLDMSNGFFETHGSLQL